MTSWTPYALCALMFAGSIGAMVLQPSARQSDAAAVSLEAIVPKHFGAWREEPMRQVEIINPQTKEILDRLYSQILTRVYVSDTGYRIMLSLAYGSDQRGSLQAHKPEVCYPAQGFLLRKNEPGMLKTAFGEIPVRRLYTTMGPRHEPLTYWFTVGDKAVQGSLQKRIVEVSFGLTGRIPDGMLFRISSIDPDEARAYRLQEQFVRDLLQAVSPPDRKRLSGLGDA